MNNVTKVYGTKIVIPECNFSIEDIVGKSEIISLIGPSGCGKSTLLRLIAGLTEPDSGIIKVHGKTVAGPDQERGMIFQKYSSFPFLNVLDNIAFPLRWVRKMNKKQALEKANYWIEKMYLNGAQKKYPHELSGGMQQRVAIARSLSMQAKILLMDEPFGALDRKIRWEMQDLVAELCFLKPEQEFTVILVTHDIPEAVYLGDRIVILNHQGKIDSIQYTQRPTESARVAQSRKAFLEMVSFFNEKIDTLEAKEKADGE